MPSIIHCRFLDHSSHALQADHIRLRRTLLHADRPIEPFSRPWHLHAYLTLMRDFAMVALTSPCTPKQPPHPLVQSLPRPLFSGFIPSYPAITRVDPCPILGGSQITNSKVLIRLADRVEFPRRKRRHLSSRTATPESTGLSTSPGAPGAPWLMYPGTPGAHIMINPPKAK